VPLVRYEAVVLRAWALGEADRLVALYTRESGRLTAVARGARRLRSRFGAALEPFTWGVLVGFAREGRGLVRLDHFDIRHPFRGVREDLLRLAQGARVVEAVLRLTAERDPSPSCFALLLRALRALEDRPAGRVQLAFALRFLDLLGHRPRFDRCDGCGVAVGTRGVTFDAGRAAVLCARCHRAGARPVPGPVLAVLRGLQAAAWDARLSAHIPSGVEEAASVLLDGYLEALGGAPLKSARFLAAAREPVLPAFMTAPPGPARSPVAGTPRGAGPPGPRA
jgi:DNA repair protein RecO (recombination protein O)